MPDRIESFLQAHGWAGATCAPLAGDASARRYFRIEGQGGRAVLMDAPPDIGEPVEPFITMTHRMRKAGLSAPEILAADPPRGLLLLEDLGDDLFARVAPTSPGLEPDLYAAAVDVLAVIASRPDMAEGLPPYDLDFLRFELAIMTDWYIPHAGGDAQAGAEFVDALTPDLAEIAAAPPVCVLRDYHAENLIWLPDRDGVAQVGLLDYQGARAGHVAYDLMSLIQDARRDLPTEISGMAVARHAAATGLDRAELEHAVAVLGLQRNLKIMGIFARLCRRDAKPGYLDLLPRVWGHVETCLAHPSLARIATLVRRAVPPPDPATRARIAA